MTADDVLHSQIVTGAPILALILLVLVMQWKNKLPSSDAVNRFFEALDSRGGNILILGCFSFYFFRHAIYLFYNLFSLERGGYVKQDDAFALMSLQFVTATAFGGAFGAMLKTMTGDTPQIKINPPEATIVPAAVVTEPTKSATESKPENPTT